MNFPDPENHLIGFMCSKRSSRRFSPHKIAHRSTRKESSNCSSGNSSRMSKKSGGSTYNSARNSNSERSSKLHNLAQFYMHNSVQNQVFDSLRPKSIDKKNSLKQISPKD